MIEMLMLLINSSRRPAPLELEENRMEADIQKLIEHLAADEAIASIVRHESDFNTLPF
jgi:hypothetical protein